MATYLHYLVYDLDYPEYSTADDGETVLQHTYEYQRGSAVTTFLDKSTRPSKFRIRVVRSKWMWGDFGVERGWQRDFGDINGADWMAGTRTPTTWKPCTEVIELKE